MRAYARAGPERIRDSGGRVVFQARRDPTRRRHRRCEFTARRVAPEKAPESFIRRTRSICPDVLRDRASPGLQQSDCCSRGTRAHSAYCEGRALRSSCVLKHVGERLWQEGYFDRVLRDDADARAYARYIVTNPMRAGLVAGAAEYKYLGTTEWTIEELTDVALNDGVSRT